MDTVRTKAGLPLLLALAVMWVVPGLFGHEPWKPDEGYTIGLIANAAREGKWVVPTLGDAPFIEKPPIFFITAALLDRLVPAGWLPLHQIAALTAALYVLLTLLFCALAGREGGAPRLGTAAALGLMGCIGYLVRAHSAITDTAMWCGFAAAVYGMLLSSRRQWAGAFWFGTGTGLTFMSKGLLGPGFLGLAAALLPLFTPERRSWSYFRFLLVSVAACLPWLVIWPWLLFRESPELFNAWLMENNLGRFLGPEFGFARRATAGTPWKYLAMIPWFTLPLWPPILLAWRRRGLAGLRDTALIYPTLVFLVGLVMLSCADTRRELYFIPLLVPLAVIACQMPGELPSWLDLFLRRLPRAVFILGAAAIWAAYLGWRLGMPALLRLLESRAPGAPEPAGLAAPLAAGVYTAVCAWLLCRSTFRRRWEWVWAAGFTLVWGVGMLLYMPVVDHVKGYHPTFAAIVSHIPDAADARVDEYQLGESQRAVLDYYFRVKTRSASKFGEGGDYLIIQNSRKKIKHAGEGWELLWEGRRPGDSDEVYLLYRRTAESD